jgi:cation diffusion facilitator CzcD-associated flavoprotein CzcO
MKHCIIGAGFSGLPIAKKLLEIGEPVEILDRNSGIGGLWHTGAYDTAHIISSKLTTEFPDFPMPCSYPDFPSRKQMQRYFEQYADYFGITPFIQLNTTVERIYPAPDYDQSRQWLVRLEDGTERRYQTVTIATGHHSVPRPVNFPGEFEGESLWSNQYRSPEVFNGKRVLVVGYGNTGCDAAVDASRYGVSSEISMRSGAYFFPKTFMGIPLAEFGQNLPIKGDWLDRLIGRLVTTFAIGDLRRYGVPKPTFRPFDKHPIVNTELLHYIRHGKVKVRPAISRFEGNQVHFVNGTTAEYDLVFYAVGYKISLPMLHPEDKLLDWQADLPLLHTGYLAPKYRGLFFSGFGQARTGGGPLFQASGYILARLIAGETYSEAGIAQKLENHLRLKFAKKWQGYQFVATPDLTSRSLRYHQKNIKQFLKILDELGCPDAPSRTGNALNNALNNDEVRKTLHKDKVLVGQKN